MKISDLAKRMIITISVISLICILASVIYYRSIDSLPFILGTILGAGLSISKVFLLEHAVDKSLEMKKSKAGSFVSLHHLFRLLLTGLVLFLGAVIQQISLWGVVTGVFAFQLALYNIRFTTKDKEN